MVTAIEQQVTTLNGGLDRRKRRRFQLQRDVRYKLLYGRRIGETETGRSVDISSQAIRFTSSTVLPAGMPLELSMNWPVLLNGSCAMKLMVCGCVLRSGEQDTVLSIERYEFRTQGSRQFPRPDIRPPVPPRLPG